MRRLLPGLVLLMVTGTAVSPADPGAAHTRVRLVADVATVRPGSEFMAGVLMTMDRGWHTYWKNPGEAGLPTSITWTLPPGMSAGEIIWPVPHKYNESGDVLTFGYADENMLLVPIRADALPAAGSSVTLHAEVAWLECERVCIPGKQSVELTLLVTESGPAPANEALFQRYRAEVAQRRTDEITVSASLTPGRVTMIVTPAAGAAFAAQNNAVPDFYPEGIDDLALGRTEVRAGPDRATLTVPVSAYEPVKGERRLRGLVLYALDGAEQRAVEWEITLPAGFVESLGTPGEKPASTGGILDREFTTVPSAGQDRPFVFYLLFALLGGLLLNIMPCVLPAISLKIFGLVRMAGDEPREVKIHGLLFAAGILASFLALALLVVLLQNAGEQVGWGFQFQEPLFVIAMSAVVFAFGLSLFGVFEVAIPFVVAFASVGTALETQSKHGKGYVASFGEGIFATILATPCTAPFLGTALGFAFSQPAALVFLIFAAVGVGMGLPYLVLTSRPSWTKLLPRPGEWMITVKQFMGFLLMATVLWLLYVLGKQLGMEAVIWTCALLLVIGIACWILGRFLTLSTPRPRYVAILLLTLILIGGGYYYFIESVLDIRTVMAGLQGAAPLQPDSAPEGIQWEPFTLATLESHLRDNSTVFIDFTADWCLTCKVNEKTVLSDRDVVEKFRSSGIVALKADWTNRNPEITALLAKFGRSGVPLYVIFPAGKPNAPLVLPEVITTGIVQDALRTALGG